MQYENIYDLFLLMTVTGTANTKYCDLLLTCIIEGNTKFHLEVSEIKDVIIFHPSSWTSPPELCPWTSWTLWNMF